MTMRWNCSVLLLLGVVLFCGCQEKETIDAQSGNLSSQKLRALAVQIVEKGLSDKSPYVRSKAVEVVSTCRITDLMPQVLHLAKDPVVPVKFSVILATGDMKYRRGALAVEKSLLDENKNVRIAAAYSMIKMGRPELIRAIRDAMKDADPTVMANAALLLGKLGDSKALPLLYAAKDNLDIADKVRFQAVEAIARIGDEKIYPKIWTMLVSKYADDRVMGIKAMGALASAKASNALITMLDDDVQEVRLVAAEQLGILGDKSGQVVVEEYFANPPPERDIDEIERQDVFAALAIGRIGSKSLRPYLAELIKSKSQQVCLAAAEAVLLPAE